MKFLVALCVLALVALSSCFPPPPPPPPRGTQQLTPPTTGSQPATPPSTQHHSRGCQYILGKCYRECEEGTHSVSTGCGPLIPEATCEEPNPVAGKGLICDYSACHCDAPTVRDSVSKKCVKLEECPKKEE